MENPCTASKGVTFAIFCALRVDVRNCAIAQETAKELLGLANANKAQAREAALRIPGAIDKANGKPVESASAKPSKADFRAIYNEARAAGLAAGNAHVPVPMTVNKHASPLDDRSPIVQRWHVPSGVCGFAWVNIKPATSSFAKWLKKEKLARSNDYTGGIDYTVFDHGQSLEQKEAHARAFSQVLTKHGIKNYGQSRMD